MNRLSLYENNSSHSFSQLNDALHKKKLVVWLALGIMAWTANGANTTLNHPVQPEIAGHIAKNKATGKAQPYANTPQWIDLASDALNDAIIKWSGTAGIPFSYKTRFVEEVLEHFPNNNKKIAEKIILQWAQEMIYDASFEILGSEEDQDYGYNAGDTAMFQIEYALQLIKLIDTDARKIAQKTLTNALDKRLNNDSHGNTGAYDDVTAVARQYKDILTPGDLEKYKAN